MKFYIEKVLDKAGKETGETHILKFRDGRIIPAPYSRVKLSSWLERIPQMVYINQLTLLGYSADEAKCRSDIQARLSETFEGRNGTQKLADEHRKLLLEYNDGLINETEIDVSCWTTLAGGFKELVAAFEAQLATDYRNKAAKEKAAADIQERPLNKGMEERATTAMAALAAAAAAASRDDAALSTDALQLHAVPPTAASAAAAAGPSAPVVAAASTATDTTATPTARASVT